MNSRLFVGLNKHRNQIYLKYEAQVATFEDKHPEFCAKLIRSITTVMNDQIDQFYADQHASSMHDHAYL